MVGYQRREGASCIHRLNRSRFHQVHYAVGKFQDRALVLVRVGLSLPVLPPARGFQMMWKNQCSFLRAEYVVEEKFQMA